METEQFTQHLVAIREGKFKDDPISQAVRAYLDLWEYEEIDVAGQVLGQIIDYAVRYHPEILAFANHEMRGFLTALDLVDNPTIDVMEIAGRANAGLAWVRARTETVR